MDLASRVRITSERRLFLFCSSEGKGQRLEGYKDWALKWLGAPKEEREMEVIGRSDSEMNVRPLRERYIYQYCL